MRRSVFILILSLLVTPSLLAPTMTAAAPLLSPSLAAQAAAGTWVRLSRAEFAKGNDLGYTKAVFSSTSVTVTAGRSSESAAKWTRAWQEPPASLAPGEPWIGNVSVKDAGSNWPDESRAEVSFRVNTINGDGVRYKGTVLKAAQVIVSVPPKAGDLANGRFEWALPGGDVFGNGSQIVVTAQCDLGAGTAMRATVQYKYELQLVAQAAPTATPKPTAQATPTTVSTPTPRPAPTPTVANDSGGTFSSMKGQVEILLPGANPRKDWHLAEMTTQLPFGARIRTMEDASAIISFEDRSTFILKPETEIILVDLKDAPGDQSKLSLIAGKIWRNVKKMAKDGTMEMGTTEVVLGIKGTTFVLEKDGPQSTLKVIEGQVSVTSRANGQTQMVNTGQTTTATNSGLTPVKTFDAVAEQKAWDAVKAEAQSGKAATAGQGNNLPIVPIIIGGAAVVVIMILAFIVMRSKKRAA